MGDWIELVARDGHRFEAYVAESDAPLGGVVVAQEIFGVNAHVRDVVERFAAHGFRAVAPALFDRLEKRVDLAYTEEGTKRGRHLRTSLGWDAPMLDVAAAATWLAASGSKVGVVGHCWGGSCAFLAACRSEHGVPACAVGYYGAQIIEHLGEHLRVPTMLHFGEHDVLIPAADVDAIRRGTDATIFVYPAGHGFNCSERADFHSASAALALDRTVAFLREHLAEG